MQRQDGVDGAPSDNSPAPPLSTIMTDDAESAPTEARDTPTATPHNPDGAAGFVIKPMPGHVRLQKKAWKQTRQSEFDNMSPIKALGRAGSRFAMPVSPFPSFTSDWVRNVSAGCLLDACLVLTGGGCMMAGQHRATQLPICGVGTIPRSVCGELQKQTRDTHAVRNGQESPHYDGWKLSTSLTTWQAGRSGHGQAFCDARRQVGRRKSRGVPGSAFLTTVTIRAASVCTLRCGGPAFVRGRTLNVAMCVALHDSNVPQRLLKSSHSARVNTFFSNSQHLRPFSAHANQHMDVEGRKNVTYVPALRRAAVC